jgi:tetratricopeptide (TPR) repeat protein
MNPMDMLYSKLPKGNEIDDFLERVNLISQKVEDVLAGQDVPVDKIISEYQKSIETKANNVEKTTASNKENTTIKEKNIQKKERNSELKVQRIQTLKRLKNEGNDHFMKKDYKKAIESYCKGVQAAGNKTMNDIESSLLVQLYSNTAQCHNKSEQFEEAISACNKAIDIDKKFAKAYMRRAFANERLGHVNDAISDYRRALDSSDLTANQKDEIRLAISECERKFERKGKEQQISVDDISQKLESLKKRYLAATDMNTLEDLITVLKTVKCTGIFIYFN